MKRFFLILTLLFLILQPALSNGEEYSLLREWGTQGSGDGQFNLPNDVAVDSSGEVYVADTYSHRIQKLDSGGGFLTKWGTDGSGDGQFIFHNSLAVDGSGDVYVADTNNNRIQVFVSHG